MEMSSSEALLTVKFHERQAEAWLGLALACVLAAAVCRCAHRAVTEASKIHSLSSLLSFLLLMHILQDLHLLLK